MTPTQLLQHRPRAALAVLAGTTLLTALLNLGAVTDLGRDRSSAVAAVLVLFVTALSCFALGVLAGLLTRRLAPMLLGYLPGLALVLLTGLQIADVPADGLLAPLEVLRDCWVLVNPLLWLPFVAVGLAWRTWSTSPAAPSPARTSGSTPGPTR